MQGKYRCHRSCSCTIASCGISGIAVRKVKTFVSSRLSTQKYDLTKNLSFSLCRSLALMKLQISYPPSPIADMTLGSCTQDTLIHPASGTPGKGEAAFQGIFVLCIPATNYDSIIPFPNTYFSTFQNVTKKVSSNDMSGLTPLPLFLPLENSPMNWDWSGQVSIAKPSFPIAVWKHFNNA